MGKNPDLEERRERRKGFLTGYLQELHPSGAGVFFFGRAELLTDHWNARLIGELFDWVDFCCFFTVASGLSMGDASSRMKVSSPVAPCLVRGYPRKIPL
jgi:hypothetical protein